MLECLLTDSKSFSSKEMNHKKKKDSPFITSINPCEEKRKPFLLADTETLFDERKNQNMDDTLTIQSENDHSQESDTIQTEMVHQPYAAGVMMVIPGIDLSENRLYTFFSEKYSKEIFPSFAERSTKMLNYFLLRIISIVKQNPSIQTFKLITIVTSHASMVLFY